DLVILRALAKDPSDRYQSAEEMDADLERVQRGAVVSPATEEAATAIISRPPPPPAAPTAITQARAPVPYAPPAAYYDYDEPRRRAFWPWLLALLFVAAAIVGGYFLYNEIQNQISGAKSVRVERYVGLREILADQKIRSLGLIPNVVRQPNPDIPETYVFRQSPVPGSKTNKGAEVTIYTSTGAPKTTVPSVVGLDSTDAVSRLADTKLKWKITKVTSDQQSGTVIAQSPTSGTSAAPGSTITLSVSKGPKTSAVPDVTSQDQASAQEQLKASGFRVRIVTQPTTDQSQDGIVLSQDPAGGTQAPPGTVVTIVVGKLSSGPPP